MSITKYMFSQKQKAMKEALGGAVTMVNTEDGWKEYTMCVVEDSEITENTTVWNDTVVVAQGEGLETRVEGDGSDGAES